MGSWLNMVDTLTETPTFKVVEGRAWTEGGWPRFAVRPDRGGTVKAWLVTSTEEG